MYKLFLSLRYLRSRRIAYMAVVAVMLCVAMVLVVLSVMGGWLEMVKRQARGLLGDIIVDNRAYAGFPLYDEFIAEIRQWPEIEQATPVIYTWGLFHFRATEQSGTVRVVGVRLEEVYAVNAFKASLFYEKHYPGTTHLGEQRQPLLGVNLDDEPVVEQDEHTGQPRRYHFRSRLPAPYHQAWEAWRRQAHQGGGGSGDQPAPDEVPSDLSDLLLQHGRPPLPGYYAVNLEGDEPTLAGEPLPGIILGRDIVADRKSDGRYERYYPRGTRVDLTLWATSATVNVDPFPIKRPLRYVDDSRTGIFDIDSQHAYCDFDLLQQLLQMGPAERVDAEGRPAGRAPARCSQIQIKTRGNVDARELCARLQARYRAYQDDPRFDLDATERRLLAQVRAVTWQESQAHIIAPVEKERILVTILFGIISLVAVALVLCILYMIVLQKTRDIGIIKALGGSSAGVALIFVLYGAAVGVAGGLLGTAFGALVVTYINDIQDFLIAINPAWRVWDLKVYSFDRIPSQVDPADVLVVVCIAIVAATLGSLAAAWRAGSMQPVEAIRHE